MVYQVNGLALMPIREVYSGPDNDVLICEDMAEEKKNYYTVILIRNHDLAKKILQIFNTEEGAKGKAYLDVFTQNEDFGMVFPYIKERLITEFYMEDQTSLETCESICINLIMECLSTPMPYPLLYIILMERQVYLRADASVQLGYPKDLTMIDEKIGEDECAVVCATILRDLLQAHADKKAASYELVSRKSKKGAYRKFKDLYFDIKMTSINPDVRNSKLQKAKAVARERSNVLFNILRFICIILIICAILCILSMLTKGKIPFLVFFSNHFKMIGTESLIK